jgi:hypothetical protein
MSFIRIREWARFTLDFWKKSGTLGGVKRGTTTKKGEKMNGVKWRNLMDSIAFKLQNRKFVSIVFENPRKARTMRGKIREQARLEGKNWGCNQVDNEVIIRIKE